MLNLLKSGKFWIGCVVGALAFGAIHTIALFLDMERTTVSVCNYSAQTLADLRITVSGVTAWSGSLAPDKTRTVSIVTPGDGSVAIELTRNGEVLRREYGYVSRMISDDYYILVRDAGEPDVLTTGIPPTLQGWFRDGER